jgi:hypothetical protein
MMERNNNVLRSVAWSELFPWLNIFRTFRLAIGFRALVLSAVAVLLMATGWAMFGRIFSTESSATGWLQPYADCPWKELTNIVPDQPVLLGGPAQADEGVTAIKNDSDVNAFMEKYAQDKKAQSIHEPLTGSWSILSQPLWKGFGLAVNFRNLLCLLCCGLWSLAIWAFFGAAITRIAVVQLAANERITLGTALRYACSKFFAYFFAPLFPLGGIALAALPIVIIGSLLWFSAGTFFVGVFLWPVLLICGLVITLLLLGLIFGWPLMWPTISTEGTDSFDALSRSYAYVFQRPLHYLFYIIVASLLGLLGWLLVKNFAAAVVWTTYWSASWGTGAARIDDLMKLDGDKLTGMTYAGAWMIHFWTGLAKLLAVGFCFSYFWNAYSAIYLLLRRNVDATEMDEVFLDADQGEAKFGLPKIVLDDAGAPEVEEKAKAAPATPPEVRENPAPVQENTPDLGEKPQAAPENPPEPPSLNIGGGNEPTPSP